MTTPDKLHISWDQNPSVREALANKKPGEKLEILLHLQVDAINPDGADFTIEAAVPPGYELADDDDTAGTPGAMPGDTTPVGLVVKSKADKAKRKSAPAPMPPSPPPSPISM